jgi:UDP-N-acetylmuramate dehydrogenase
MGIDSAAEQLKNEKDIRVYINEPLSHHTGFQTGGNAALMAIPQSREGLIEAIRLLRRENVPFFVLGKGSNVLALDGGYAGCVVKTERALTEITFGGDAEVYCEAGVSLAALCRGCAERGLSGLEFAFGIPGTVGGAVFMNAGAYDGEMKNVVSYADLLLLDGNTKRVDGEALRFSYRHSAVQENGAIILGAGFKLTAGDKNEINAKMNELMGRRRDKQPLEYPSCGSTFKRPDGAYASKLIDECGLRGYTVGGACVSDKHCGFIINKSKATSDEILELVDFVKKTVKEKTGFSLECEIRILK